MQQENFVPTTNSVMDIYAESKIPGQIKRYRDLFQEFKTIYGFDPEFVARSPGRVNIIGEHIDYAGFPVLPMAVDRDCLIAVATTKLDSKVRLANVNPKFTRAEFSFVDKERIVDIDDTVHEWTNYFKAGYKGMLESLKLDAPVGMFCLMDGSVPSGAGMSSSSALVCTSSIATMIANKKCLSKNDIVQIAIASERYVGTNGGGMDQTASIMSHADAATFIEFHPKFITTPVHFPATLPAISFVVANTMVVADKVVSAPVCYNLRVVETKVAAMILANKLGLLSERPQTLKEVMDLFFAGSEEPKYATVTERWIFRLGRMLELVEQFITQHDGYSLAEMAEAAGLSEDEIHARFMSKYPVRADVFHIYARAIHVYSEALRVVQFRDVCERNQDTVEDSQVVLHQLGRLMNESQVSCRDNYHCSCKELDDLTLICRKAGAYGSRLTGAGWGGCTVSMVPEDQEQEFIQRVKDEYFRPRFPDYTEEQLSNVIFSSRPSSGAFIYRKRTAINPYGG
ncbi:galactokinase [Basidiobolus meristosporus CBS 931.73]|uniref:Galactokinase n=1 Tax=Basidiobolus meristosporus CBS 931.73 TaxID=1314790 RepID=A0A1Y1X3Z1_9FUNG|nr:galactokinase [Basidiobolus meristosporus CBS 931.73]|eukprot:ORX80530.1 galactokinase [Basidiobolus meristosporus CBS 931.73]